MVSNPNDPTNSDELRRYLDQIADQQPLDANQERRLSAAIVAGHDAERELQGDPFLTDDTREGLLATVTAAAGARRRLIQANLHAVVGVAARSGRQGHDLLELVQHGNTGLLRAADRFDASAGGSFSTYAAWWIRQAINEAPDPTEPLPRPTDPTWWDELERERLDDTPPAPERPRPADVPAVTAELSPYEESAAALERQTLHLQLSRLSYAERVVMAAKLGLDEDDTGPIDRTDALGLSRDHIRSLEQMAMSKMRHPTARRPWTNSRIAAF